MCVPMVHVHQWYVCTNGTCIPMVHVYQWYYCYGGINEKIFFSSIPSLSLSHPLSFSLPLSPCLTSSISNLLHATVISLQYYFTYVTLYLITFVLSEI